MIFGLFRRASSEAVVHRLYAAVVWQRRGSLRSTPGLGIPDTFEGRFESLTLHATLVLRRLQACEAPGPALAQELVDTVFAQFDRTLREMGVGDTTVPKRMKTMAEAFLGRSAAYAAVLGLARPRAGQRARPATPAPPMRRAWRVTWRRARRRWPSSRCKASSTGRCPSPIRPSPSPRQRAPRLWREAHMSRRPPVEHSAPPREAGPFLAPARGPHGARRRSRHGHRGDVGRTRGDRRRRRGSSRSARSRRSSKSNSAPAAGSRSRAGSRRRSRRCASSRSSRSTPRFRARST